MKWLRGCVFFFHAILHFIRFLISHILLLSITAVAWVLSECETHLNYVKRMIHLSSTGLLSSWYVSPSTPTVTIQLVNKSFLQDPLSVASACLCTIGLFILIFICLNIYVVFIFICPLNGCTFRIVRTMQQSLEKTQKSTRGN